MSPNSPNYTDDPYPKQAAFLFQREDYKDPRRGAKALFKL